MKNQKLLLFMAWVTLISTVSLGLLFAYWAFYPYKTIKLDPMPLKIVGSKTLKAGDYVTYETSFEKFTDVIPTQYKHFEDGLMFNISQENSKPGIIESGTGKIRFQIQIPETLPAGTYRIHTDTYYQMNPIRTIHEESWTEDFIVIGD